MILSLETGGRKGKKVTADSSVEKGRSQKRGAGEKVSGHRRVMHDQDPVVDYVMGRRVLCGGSVDLPSDLTPPSQLDFLWSASTGPSIYLPVTFNVQEAFNFNRTTGSRGNDAGNTSTPSPAGHCDYVEGNPFRLLRSRSTGVGIDTPHQSLHSNGVLVLFSGPGLSTYGCMAEVALWVVCRR